MNDKQKLKAISEIISSPRKVVSGDQVTIISRINRDGLGVETNLPPNYFTTQDAFELIPLSRTEGTYIITGMNAFVVRLKTNEQ